MPLDYPGPPLETLRVCLRKWSLEDLACVEAAASDPEIPRGTTVPSEYTDDGGREWIERQWSRQSNGEGLSLAIAEVDTSSAVGIVYLGLRKPDGHCELGYWLIPGARGRGLATEAVRVASRWVLNTSDVYRLFALVAPDNTASQSVLLKSGFTREGILRSYLRSDRGDIDLISFSMLEGDVA